MAKIPLLVFRQNEQKFFNSYGLKEAPFSRPLTQPISGDAGCDPLECNLFGKQCQGTLVGEENAT